MKKIMILPLCIAGIAACHGCADSATTTYIEISCKIGDSALCLCNDGQLGTMYCQTNDEGENEYGVCECSSNNKPSPCEGVTCPNGTCIPGADDTAVCLCLNGYISSRDENGSPTCIQSGAVNGDRCENVDCAGHGLCVNTAEDAVCLCESGYVSSVDAERNTPTCVPASSGQIPVGESPCNGVTCSDHGACIVTGDNKPYCLCEDGYHLSKSDTKVCDPGSAESNPCKDITCSNHGVCIVTSDAKPYCICESGYSTVSATTCKRAPSSSVGVSNGNAYPFETVDPWGLVWDSLQRQPKTHEEAEKLCTSLGGRLPSRNEIRRNNHNPETGFGGVGDVYQTDVLWTSSIGFDLIIVTSLANGSTTSSTHRDTPLPFRCVWDPEERPITMTGVNCHSSPGDAEPCVKMNLGKNATPLIYHVDRYDRATLPWHAAQQDCRQMGGRLPTANELMALVLAGLPNGSDNPLWTSDNGFTGDDGSHPFVFKWKTTQTTTYAFDKNWDHQIWHKWAHYRCVYEDIELVGGQPVFPQPKAAEAMIVTPLLLIDKEERKAATYWEATHDCRSDGGRLAAVDEMAAAIRAGLRFTNNDLHLTRTSYGTDIWGLKSGVNSGSPGKYWDIKANATRAKISDAHPYFCTYRPNRDSAVMVQNLDKHVEGTYAYRVIQDFTGMGGGKIMHYVRDANDRAGTNVVTNTLGANSDGMFLPSDDDLFFMIRNGLENGSDGQLMSSKAVGWLKFRSFRWKGRGNKDFDPVANSAAIDWKEGNNPYRAYYSTVIY